MLIKCITFCVLKTLMQWEGTFQVWKIKSQECHIRPKRKDSVSCVDQLNSSSTTMTRLTFQRASRNCLCSVLSSLPGWMQWFSSSAWRMRSAFRRSTITSCAYPATETQLRCPWSSLEHKVPFLHLIHIYIIDYFIHYWIFVLLVLWHTTLIWMSPFADLVC